MSARASALIVAVLLVPLSSRAQLVDVAAQRAAWQYRLTVTVPAGPSPATSGFVALVVPPEVMARSQPDLQDLRLLEADGREVPYVVDRAVERAATNRWNGRLADTRREVKVRTVWIVDLEEPRSFDAIVLDIRETNFTKRLRVEASGDAQTWRLVKDDAGVFDRPWKTRVHHTTITLAEPTSARYLRLTADDRQSAPVDLRGAEVTTSRRISGAEWRRPVGLVPIASRPGVSRYRLALPPRFPLETLELSADEPAFSRRAVLVELREVGGQTQEAPLGDGTLYRLRIDDRTLAGEMLALPVRRSQGGELILEVHDEDSPSLRGLRASAVGVVTHLLFPAGPGALTLYYGNNATRAPLYDLEPLRDRLALGTTFVLASLGLEEPNPQFVRATPIPFVASRGAAVQVAAWSAARRFAIEGRDDLYSVTLSPEDVARSGPQFADLRIVDESDRQLPYVLEPSAAEARPSLTVERQKPPAGVGGATLSRYRLTFSGSTPGTTLALPLTALELRVQEEFFSRPARVLAPPPAGGDRERSLVSGTLVRARAVEGAASSGPIVLALPKSTEREIFLEIDEGDNAPLTLRQAQGVLRVPRVTFKAGPGQYRVLLGNREAESPRYDIESLRREILSYSAVRIEAAPLEVNPAFRRPVSDVLGGVPSSVLLWGVLAVAVITLLALTVRLLRTNPTAGPGS